MSTLTFGSGMKLLAAKQHEALYARSIEALQANEKNPLAFFFLGILASTLGEGPKTLELFAKATEHGPKTARYQAYHAKALMAQGYKPEAKLRADIAAKIGTSDAFLADMIGTVYSRAGYHDLALPLFKKAAKLNPIWAVFQFNLAACAQFLGDFKQAKSAYKHAVALDPNLYEAWFALAGLDTQTTADNDLEQLKGLFNAASKRADARLLLGHSIAKTYEDIGEYKESLKWLKNAKSLKRNHLNYSQEQQAQLFRAAKAAPLSPFAANPAQRSNIPVFIFGMPRTGTTLVDRILSSHPDVTSEGELNIFSGLIRKTLMDSGANPAAMNVFQAKAGPLSVAAKAYLNAMESRAQTALRVIDKTPLNFLYAGLIHRAFPNARMIALRRGAMDTCLSNYRQLFALQNREYDYAYDLENIAHYYSQFDALMAHWRKELPKDRFIEMRYEDIIFDQENQTRLLLQFCDLEWDEACLRFHENAAPVDSASSVQVRRPLNADGIDRWKKYGETLEGLKAALGDLASE